MKLNPPIVKLEGGSGGALTLIVSGSLMNEDKQYARVTMRFPLPNENANTVQAFLVEAQRRWGVLSGALETQQDFQVDEVEP